MESGEEVLSSPARSQIKQSFVFQLIRENMPGMVQNGFASLAVLVQSGISQPPKLAWSLTPCNQKVSPYCRVSPPARALRCQWLSCPFVIPVRKDVSLNIEVGHLARIVDVEVVGINGALGESCCIKHNRLISGGQGSCCGESASQTVSRESQLLVGAVLLHCRHPVEIGDPGQSSPLARTVPNYQRPVLHLPPNPPRRGAQVPLKETNHVSFLGILKDFVVQPLILASPPVNAVTTAADLLVIGVSKFWF